MDGKRVPVFCYCVYSRSILPAAVGKKRQDERLSGICVSRSSYISCDCIFTRNPQTDYHYNLDLFWSWRAVFRGSREMLKEDILNIVLLLPLGGLLPFVFDKKIRWWQGLLCGIVVSLGIEILQLVLKRGLFEFDDIMNNSIGCMLGCIFGNLVAYLLAGKPIWHRDR